ncbi:hypothetical protein PRCB_02965 [Pantoea rodasii]|uniref:Uncharacterized protein n=1 Tax=Pantoea rodasii TaxID=1076549 RepID=A0A2M9WHE8_9GAMM|nr:hypothetical protein PRCB_02965 [Pantoea rodasii]
MYLCVTSCEHYDAGARRIYHLNDGSTVEERRDLPVVSRWLCWDSHNYRVYKKSLQAAMKQAAERHKKRSNFQ